VTTRASSGPRSAPPRYEGAYEGARVLVLGGAGFIGRWVARSVSIAGAKVTCAARHPESAREILATYGVRGEVAPVDLREPEAVRSLFRNVRPAVTFNLSGYGVDRSEQDEALAWRINDELVEEIASHVEAFGDPTWRGTPLIHAGSALEYGPIGGDLEESVVAHPTTTYGRSKLAGTQRLVERCRPASVTARLFTVYGPGEHAGRLLPSLMVATQAGAHIPLSLGLQRRDFTYVEDVADGLLRLALLQNADDRIVNLATGRLHSVREFADEAAAVLGIPEGVLEFGALPTRPDEMPHDAVAVERLRRLIGWTPSTSIADGVARAASVLRSLEREATPRA